MKLNNMKLKINIYRNFELLICLKMALDDKRRVCLRNKQIHVLNKLTILVIMWPVTCVVGVSLLIILNQIS
jgi:hypothetical protein